MSVARGVFIALSTVTLAAAVGVVTNRNLFRSALLMILSFVGVAGIYVLLEAGFLAAVQVLVYVGAIAILIIFGVMLTPNMMRRDIRAANRQWLIGLVVAAALFVLLVFVLTSTGWRTVSTAAPQDAISGIGEALVGDYLVPFEVASVLLLVALVGAIIIARERE